MGWELFKTASKVTGRVENVSTDKIPWHSVGDVADQGKTKGFWIFSPDFNKWVYITTDSPYQSDVQRISANKLRDLGGL